MAHESERWRNARTPRARTVTTRQLDTLCKATETLSSIWVERGGHPKLHEKLVTLLRESGAEYRRLNTAHIEAMEADLTELKGGK